jgi:hypothetical protein
MTISSLDATSTSLLAADLKALAEFSEFAGSTGQTLDSPKAVSEFCESIKTGVLTF